MHHYSTFDNLFCNSESLLELDLGPDFALKQVKPDFTNYQPQPKYSGALSKIEVKEKLFWKFQTNLKICGSLKILNKSENFGNKEKKFSKQLASDAIIAQLFFDILTCINAGLYK